MSAKAFSIILCPSSLCPSACPSLCPSDRLLTFFSKPISSYSFDWIAFKFYTGINHKVAYAACTCFDDRICFEFLAIFLKFLSIIYSNCKMYLLLQISLDRFEIIRGSSIGYRKYGLCFFLTDGLFMNLWRIFEF